jgi:large subunit ribosomal protein L24e
MVDKKVCSFCGGDIEPGTGLMFIKKDGNSFNFCSKKCKINLLELGRSPRLIKWTTNFVKETTQRAAEKESISKKSKVNKEETPEPETQIVDEKKPVVDKESSDEKETDNVKKSADKEHKIKQMKKSK